MKKENGKALDLQASGDFYRHVLTLKLVGSETDKKKISEIRSYIELKIKVFI